MLTSQVLNQGVSPLLIAILGKMGTFCSGLK